MPILLTHDGKTWKLVPKVGEGFTSFEWVEVSPKQEQQPLETSE